MVLKINNSVIFNSTDRRAHTLQNALEESRTMLEQADRARRAAEQELQVLHCCSYTLTEI